MILRFCQLLPPRNLTDVCVSVSCYFLAMSSSSDAAMSQGAPPRVSVHVTVETDGARLTISLEAGRSVESELGCSMGLDLLNEYLGDGFRRPIQAETRFLILLFQKTVTETLSELFKMCFIYCGCIFHPSAVAATLMSPRIKALLRLSSTKIGFPTRCVALEAQVGCI